MLTFKRAIRANVNLLIGLAGGTGAGKSVSALRLARGLSGDKPFCVIDTESGRGLHNADMCQPWDHGDLKAPFSPEAYTAAILTADAAGYPVIICDSFSHCWAGDGGCMDIQEYELDRMAGQDWKKREACKLAAWIKPKMAYKAMMQKLLQIRAHLILCFRAEQRIEMVKGYDGKMQIVPKQTLTGLDGWVPVTEKSTPFELTVSFLLTANTPGVPKPIKLPNALRDIFPLDKPITEESGKRLAQWASGAKTTESAAAQTTREPEQSAAPSSAPAAVLITDEEALSLEARCTENEISVEALRKAAKVERLALITTENLVRCHQWIDKAIAARKEKAA